MPRNLLNKQEIETLRALMCGEGKVVIVCHMSPDGDALGSSLCLWNLLRDSGRTANVVVPDMPPHNLSFLPGYDEITVASCHPERAGRLAAEASLIFCLDFNDFARIDRLAPAITESGAVKVMIDHHLNPVAEVDLRISHPEISSTCALLYLVLEQAGLTSRLSREAAECCCTGMMTDTGNFSYNSNDPELYRILSHLMETGIDKDAIYTRLFNTNSVSRVRIMGYGQSAKMQLFPEHQAALITLSRVELNEFDYHRGDTEALVNVPLSIPSVTYSVFLREDEENYVKVSMRSKGDFSVKDICEKHFSGGGHINAAGGEMRRPLAEVVARLIEVMPDYDCRLPENKTNQI